MKYLSIKQSVVTFNPKNKLVLIFKTDKLSKNKFEQFQGVPCIIKPSDVPHEDILTYTEALQYTNGEDFTVSFKSKKLPETEFTVVEINSKLIKTDEYEYHDFIVRPLGEKSVEKAREAYQKLTNSLHSRKELEGTPFEL